MVSTAFTNNSINSNSEKQINLDTVAINGESYFKISNSDQMRPFFMSIVSDSNHWMFISSNGGLTAGRKNSEYSLFPYYTDDKISESAEVTGSKSMFWIDNQLWEPFSIRQQGLYNVSRNLYKNSYGNKVIFEEINHDLEVTFRYAYNSSNIFGFIKKATLINHSLVSKDIKILDGLQNILPYGVPTDTQNAVSNLVDAYKRNQLEKKHGLGIYALSAIIVDKAEPSEALKANTVWSKGFDNPKYLVSSLQLDTFRKTGNITEEIDVKAEKGAYFLNTEITIKPSEKKEWFFVANVNQDHADIAHLTQTINSNIVKKQIDTDINIGTERLIKLTAAADGIQLTNDKPRSTRHFANTLFNIMRGGIFDDNYTIEKWDFIQYISKANKKVYAESKKKLEHLAEAFSLFDLRKMAYDTEDKSFRRLCLEYMPLKFSRRHGDPSRPWNKFSINTRNEVDGSKVLDYEGNWRDIFQNWEALAHTYPEFVESMIHKFLNATTFEGYNPYRVTKDGFDWETIEPDDPWSYIGYWGDHQIIYLLKFLEFIEQHKPGKLNSLFKEDVFVYANVPYKIKSYEAIVKNPKDTIEFDEALDAQIRKERDNFGADGALLLDKNSEIHRVNFIEKILATVLAKVSNFVPEAGIWLNTQRPEWNDANNALVGNGVSMVTLNYLRRFLKFFNKIVENSNENNFQISEELNLFFNAVNSTLDSNKNILSGAISDTSRKKVLDGLGLAGSKYRVSVYEKSFSGEKTDLSKSQLQEFVKTTLNYLEHTIEANRRKDNMHHAYNLITIENDEVKIDYLDEMLEGQVAALSSGYLDAKESVEVLDSMKSSKIFRPDQYSYLLYPNKDLPRFMEKNNIPKTAVETSKLLQKLIHDGNRQIIIKAVNGNFHFNGNFNNANKLEAALDALNETYAALVNTEKEAILEIYETVFNHKAFTGRSGTFYGYEGLGSIYWHMVSKLQLAVQETCLKAINQDASDEIVGKLLEHYYEINEGIGAHKSPDLYGAFPTDPYSHTPAGKGAQQPGMTGQVKEDILSRIGELGVFVKDGQLTFNPCMLRYEEFLQQEKTFDYVSVSGENKSIALKNDTIAFTYCQVPIVYKVSDSNSITIYFSDGQDDLQKGLKLNKNVSHAIFRREGIVDRLEINIDPNILK